MDIIIIYDFRAIRKNIGSHKDIPIPRIGEKIYLSQLNLKVDDIAYDFDGNKVYVILE